MLASPKHILLEDNIKSNLKFVGQELEFLGWKIHNSNLGEL
jgi:hypothetical protein